MKYFAQAEKILGKNTRPRADSRQVCAGDVFIAYRGEYADGRDFIADALDNGAAAVLYDSADNFRLPETLAARGRAQNIPLLAVENLREHAGDAAAEILGFPAQKLTIAGVTGTNGKTSVSQWLAQAWNALGKKCAVTGTVGNGFLENLQPATHTTPDAVTLHNLLADFAAAGAQAVSMEVSSHGLAQYRVSGVPFDTAVFTNLTRDHLDYHGSMEAYGAAKEKLFWREELRTAVINTDDAFGQKLAAKLAAQRQRLTLLTYSFGGSADIRIRDFQAALSGNRITLDTPSGSLNIHSALLGRFNALNLAACCGVLLAQGIGLESLADILPQIRPARGRMQCLPHNAAQPLVVIDYAHTPDALEKALTTLQELRAPSKKLWCVFGCGGNRDKGKRPLMGAVAAQYADCAVVTSDNPRLEDPQAILADILLAVPHPAFAHPDRRTAIRFAVHNAAAGDIVLIAGKGHEDYQDAGGQKHHFDDFEEARAALASAG